MKQYKKYILYRKYRTASRLNERYRRFSKLLLRGRVANFILSLFHSFATSGMNEFLK